jgi:hypothetical protein
MGRFGTRNTIRTSRRENGSGQDLAKAELGFSDLQNVIFWRFELFAVLCFLEVRVVSTSGVWRFNLLQKWLISLGSSDCDRVVLAFAGEDLSRDCSAAVLDRLASSETKARFLISAQLVRKTPSAPLSATSLL